MSTRGLLLLVALTASCGRGARTDAAVVAERLYGEQLEPLTATGRDEALRRATIFSAVDIATLDPGTRRVPAVVDCTFVEPSGGAMQGTSPKFYCTAANGDRLKIKYGRTNREIYSEVLGSRLLTLLGLVTDTNEPARIRCRNCPADPWHARGTPRLPLVEIDDAIVQRLAPALILEACTRREGSRCRERRVDQGWSYDELGAIDASVGGATPAEVDAFRLLTVFIAHADDKPSNHRLVCPLDAIEGGRCTRPRLMISDLGTTFGRGAPWIVPSIDTASHTHFAAWSKLPVWKDATTCRAKLHKRREDSDPTVSEAGRAFLAARLAALSDAQIRTMFEFARVERLGEMTREGSAERPVTADDWAVTFARKRREILERKCPD